MQAAGSNTAIRALESPSNPQSPRLGLRQSLLSALPGNHEVIATLNSNDYWWESFRKKTRAISQTDDIEPLGSFAARALADGSPAELATVVISYERSLDTDYRRLAVVEEHVMSSYNLLCTLQGLECLILLAKTYTDIGKPKRAWFTWRKGIAAVQFLVRPALISLVLAEAFVYTTSMLTSDRVSTGCHQMLRAPIIAFGGPFITGTASPACFSACPTDSMMLYWTDPSSRITATLVTLQRGLHGSFMRRPLSRAK